MRNGRTAWSHARVGVEPHIGGDHRPVCCGSTRRPDHCAHNRTQLSVEGRQRHVLVKLFKHPGTGHRRDRRRLFRDPTRDCMSSPSRPLFSEVLECQALSSGNTPRSVGWSVVGQSVACSQNSLTRGSRASRHEYPQVKKGTAHTCAAGLLENLAVDAANNDDRTTAPLPLRRRCHQMRRLVIRTQRGGSSAGPGGALPAGRPP